MKIKNKIVAAVLTIALFSIGILTIYIAGSSQALFKDAQEELVTGKAGGISLADVEILIGSATGYRILDSTLITQHSFLTEKSYTPTWGYPTNSGYVVLKDDYFRDLEGNVTYCVDYGKKVPSSGISNEATMVADNIKRLLKFGYPAMNGSSYDDTALGYSYSNEDLEWATAVAIYILEKKAYDSNGILQPEEDALALHYFGDEFDTIVPTGTDSTAILKAEKLLHLLELLVSKANDNTIPVESFLLTTDNVNIIEQPDGFLAGPYKISSNFTSSTIELTSSTPGTIFKDTNGNVITTVSGSSDNYSFYALIPLTSISSDTTITASIPGKTMLPQYYYWSGAQSEQKMVIYKQVIVESSIHVETSLSTSFNGMLPGDIFDIQFNVENIGNKSVLTRNTIYIYWDQINPNANANESIYLYSQNTPKEQIQNELLSQTITSNINIGSLQTFLINGVEKTGYKFTVYGDTLDGIGDAGIAETGVSSETNYNSSYDDVNTTKDTISYKLAFSNWANKQTEGMSLNLAVVTEAMQYQNTIGENGTGDWTAIKYTETQIGN